MDEADRRVSVVEVAVMRLECNLTPGFYNWQHQQDNHSVTTTTTSELKELDELRKLLLQNGYPAGVFNYNINDVLNRQQNKPKNPTTTVPKKETILVLPYLGVQSKIVTKQLKTCINKF